MRLVGVAVYSLYRPHGTLAAGVAAIATGVYELTPIKQHFRWCCRDRASTGFGFGAYCVGSSIGLMLLLVALSPMSVRWMSVVAVLVLAQKLLPPQAVVDLPRRACDGRTWSLDRARALVGPRLMPPM